ncbi:MAG TPA: efflux RND transporter periplasmic adaptor subunit [Salinimicrobium sp.]|nr:efflux RND transporter periplasmic adaptor subunit [Salinimicrobium sp.]
MNLLVLSFVLLGLVSCNNASEGEETANIEGHEEEGEHAEVEEAMLSQQQYDALNMKIDTLKQRTMSGYVEANGELEVPPQNEASVTTVLGANVDEIMVIEGEQVEKGQPLAYISHPDIVQLQTDFLNAANQLNFQEKEFQRQQKLYEAGVGSGESFQRAEAAYQSAQGLVNGLKAQLKLLDLNPEAILNGTIFQRIPVLSPISGAIQEVNVKTGQYVQPQTSMFEIVNTEHVHADLMVFEEDVSKIEVGQEVNFTVGALPDTRLKANILSISKTFEQDPKAVHVHAEIENKPENLIPGMYVRGRINVENTQTTAFPESAIAKDGDTFYVFKAEREGEAWSFRPVEVTTGASDGQWVEVNFLSPVEPGTQFAYNNAYYLMAEMSKGEGGHSH